MSTNEQKAKDAAKKLATRKQVGIHVPTTREEIRTALLNAGTQGQVRAAYRSRTEYIQKVMSWSKEKADQYLAKNPKFQIPGTEPKPQRTPEQQSVFDEALAALERERAQEQAMRDAVSVGVDAADGDSNGE